MKNTNFILNAKARCSRQKAQALATCKIDRNKQGGVVFYIFISLFFLTWNVTAAEQAETTQKTIYEHWHQTLDANSFLTEPLWFSTNTPLKNLTAVVNLINSNKISLAYYLCEKIASETNCPYEDINLLDHVAGINLWFPDHPTEDIQGVTATNLARFRAEWKAGVYKDPSKKIALLCDMRLVKESGDNLNPREIVALRRYGIFGLPELTRQMKQHNSKHAFAAYLMIVNQPNEYSEYIKHSSQQFTNAAAKLSHVRKKTEELKEHDENKHEILNKISDAINNQP